MNTSMMDENNSHDSNMKDFQENKMSKNLTDCTLNLNDISSDDEENSFPNKDDFSSKRSNDTAPPSDGSRSEENEGADKKVRKSANPLLHNPYNVKEYVFVIIAGLGFAFNAGYANGCCLSGLLTASGAQQSVAGFTGSYTKSAIVLAAGDTDEFQSALYMILSFMFGSFISGFMTPKAQSYRIAPTYGPTFLLGGVFMCIASILAATHDRGNHFFNFAAAANGIQNGITSLYSSNLIRTTHLTGTSTDIGLFLGQLARGNTANLWKLKVLIGLAAAFWCGGLMSFWATKKFTSSSLLFSASLFLAIGVSLVVFLVKSLGVTYKQAILGSWQWKKALGKLNLVGEDGEPASEDFLMEVFDRMDADQSGFIDEDELFLALKEAGLKGITMKSVKAMISVIDEDDDGVISKDEWRELVIGEHD